MVLGGGIWRGFRWTVKREEAALLVAQDELSNEEIARRMGISRQGLDEGEKGEGGSLRGEWERADYDWPAKYSRISASTCGRAAYRAAYSVL